MAAGVFVSIKITLNYSHTIQKHSLSSIGEIMKKQLLGLTVVSMLVASLPQAQVAFQPVKEIEKPSLSNKVDSELLRMGLSEFELNSAFEVPGDSILNWSLFQNENLKIKVTHFSRKGNTWTLLGNVIGSENSAVFLFHNGDYLNGKVELSDRVLNLSGENSGVVKVEEISIEKQDEKPICEQDSHDLHIDGASLLKPVVNTELPPASNSTIDILVVYSSEYAASYSNSQSQIKAQIETRVAEANVIFERSQIGVTFVLLGFEEISLSDNTTSGSTVAGSSEAKNIREQYGADLVSFWTVNGSAGSAQNYSGNSSSAYNTSRKRDIESRYTFVHEMGHSMGAKHDRQTYVDKGRGDELTPSLYKYGKSFTNYRTVMSYDNCPSGNSCNRIMNFTNPDIDHNGVPTGIAYDPSNPISDKSNGPADNARRLNDTRASIEQFRTRKVSVSSAFQSSMAQSSSVQPSSSSLELSSSIEVSSSLLQSSDVFSSSGIQSSSSADNLDCQSIEAWDSSKGYNGKDEDGDGTPDSPLVSYEGKKYALIAWWSQSNNPKSNSNIWKDLGTCVVSVSSETYSSSLAQSSSSDIIVSINQKSYIKNNSLYLLEENSLVEIYGLNGTQLQKFVVSGAAINIPLKLHSGSYLISIKTTSGTEVIKFYQK